MSRKEAKSKIVELFKTEETLDYGTIVERLQLSLPLVVDICNELEEEGKISEPGQEGKKKTGGLEWEKDFYGWDKFCEWANEQGVSLEHKDDWATWWECWKAGYDRAIEIHG